MLTTEVTRKIDGKIDIAKRRGVKDAGLHDCLDKPTDKAWLMRTKGVSEIEHKLGNTTHGLLLTYPSGANGFPFCLACSFSWIRL
jgi:hypothetical protein